MSRAELEANFREFFRDVSRLDRNFTPEVREAFGVVLRRTMSRMRKWTVPPSAWDYSGKSWRATGVLDDLLDDCVRFVCCRAHGLNAQLKRGQPILPAVEGMFRNFLINAEWKKDRPGASIFKNLQQGAELAFRRGRLSAPQGRDPRGKVANGTRLVFPGAALMVSPVDGPTLRALVRAWPELPEALESLTHWSSRTPEDGGRVSPGVAAAMALLDYLGGCRVGAVLVQDLVDALKEEFAARSPAHEPILPECTPANTPRPDVVLMAAEERDEFYRHVREQLDRAEEDVQESGCQQRVIRRRLAILHYVRRVIETEHRMPTQAEVVKKRHLPRSTVNDDWEELLRLLRGNLDK